MGGKTGTSTASTSIPPEVLARYNAVNKTAQDTAAQPFQQYSSDASAFVAPLNEQQQAATAQTNRYANAAQPSIEYAQQGYTPEGYQKGVQGYMNPFLSNAMGSTAAQLNNVNQQQQQQMIGSAIGQGAFGGDRANIGLGNLENQQNLAMGQTLGNMASQGYQNAAQNYMTGLGQIGNLGIQGQQAGLQGAQAMMGAGTLGQQTTQAGKTALYNQFQQQQAYPFQVAQFLANIAEGTGALSGSTTTQTSPQSFFGSDERIKHDIKRVGTAHNGLPIYTFKYKGDQAEQTHIGYMAQDVEKIHPEAVAKDQHGIRYVNYDKASEPAHRALGGANFNPAANLMTGGSDQTSQDPEWLKKHPAPEGHGGDNKGPAGFVTNHDYSPSSGYGGGIAGMAGSLGSAIGKMNGEVTGDSGVGGTEGQGMYAHGGVIPNHEGGAVMPHHMGQGFAVGGDVVSPTDMGALIAQQQQSFSPHGEAGMYGSSPQMTPGAKGFVPAANMHVAKLQAPQISNAGQNDTLMGDLKDATSGADTVKKVYGYGKDFSDWTKTLGHASGGSVGPYATDDPMSQVVSDTEKDKDRQLMKSPIANPKGNSTFGDLMSLAKLPSEIAGIGSAASSIGSGIGSALLALAPIGLASGGVVGREHHDGSEGNIVGDQQPEITPDYVRDVAAKSAAKAGIDPTRSLQIGQLESAFNHNAVGDQGSSFGPWQMHYGNMSEKYPHSGLGDVFTKETGLDLRDPNVRKDPQTIQANSDWVANYMKDHGDSAWSTSRNLSAPSKNEAPTQSAPSTRSESPDFGIGKPDNTDVLLSVLSGLGSMAGSQSRYLGAAILEGIGGGAKTYSGLRNQRSEIALRQSEAMKNTMGLMAQRFSPLPDGSFFDAWNNKKVSASERAQAAVEMGLPASFVSGAAGAPQGEQKTIGEAVNGPSQGETPAAPSGVVAPQSSVASPSGVVPPKVETTSAGNGVLPKPETVTQGAAPTTPADAIYAAAEKNPQVVKYNSMADNYLAQAEKLEGEAHQWSQMGRDNQSSALIAQAGALRSQSQQSREIAMKMRDQYAALPLASEVKTAQFKGEPQTVFDADGNQHQVTGDVAYKVTQDGKGMLDGTPVYPSPPASAYLVKNIDNYGEFSKKAMDYDVAYKNDRAALDSLAHVLQNWKSGRAANAVGEFEGLFKYLGVPVPKEYQGASTGLDTVTKMAALIGINASKGMAAGAPATNLQETMQTAPEAFRDPDALYKNLADRMIAMDISHKMYRDWDQQGQPKNIVHYVNDWNDANKYGEFRDPIYDNLGLFKGSSEAGQKVISAKGPTVRPPANYPDARQGNDGKFYIPDPNRAGKYMMVQ